MLFLSLSNCFNYFVFFFFQLKNSLIEEHMEGQNRISNGITSKVNTYLAARSIFQNENSTCRVTNNNSQNNRSRFECLSLNVSPDLGERVMLSGERNLIEEVFPEISQTLMDARSGIAWNHDTSHVIRFPLNGYTKLVSLQAITRLLDAGFVIAACSGGGVDLETQFFNYLFVRSTW